MKTKIKITGTKEWAAKNINCVSGCSHDCWYCYAKAGAIRFKRKTSATWKDEEPVGSKPVGGKPCRVMFPTTHDITPAVLSVCLEQIRNILSAGHEILIVSKPHVECIAAICERFEGYKEKILFRFTIGSASIETLKLWEPGAPSFEERLEALRLAHRLGFKTSVSCEPMLDNNIEAVVSAVEPYITDAVWLGKMNQVKARLTINKAPADVVQAAEALAKEQSDENIRDLYQRLKDNPKIKWKDSIKAVVGIAAPKTIGLDV
jgi:DNA repair photolyase